MHYLRYGKESHTMLQGVAMTCALFDTVLGVQGFGGLCTYVEIISRYLARLKSEWPHWGLDSACTTMQNNDVEDTVRGLKPPIANLET